MWNRINQFHKKNFWWSKSFSFLQFINGQKPIFELGNSLKLPNMQFHEKNFFEYLLNKVIFIFSWEIFSFNLFPTSKIGFWPFLKWQKMKFGQKKFRENEKSNFIFRISLGEMVNTVSFSTRKPYPFPEKDTFVKRNCTSPF